MTREVPGLFVSLIYRTGSCAGRACHGSWGIYASSVFENWEYDIEGRTGSRFALDGNITAH